MGNEFVAFPSPGYKLYITIFSIHERSLSLLLFHSKVHFHLLCTASDQSCCRLAFVLGHLYKIIGDTAMHNIA